MNKKLQFTLLFSFFSLLAFSQHGKDCYAQHKLKKQLDSNPDFKIERLHLEKQISEMIASAEKDQFGSTLIIPVVFHIIHNGDNIGVQENITDALISEQLDQLNADYSQSNTNFDDTPSAFLAQASNMDIQFCLTEIDPTGLESTGINRYHINSLPGVNESDCWTPDYIDANIVSPTIWNRDNYLNIYSVIAIDELVNSSCNFFSHLGYGQFPGGPASTDAVVAAFYTFGSLNSPNPLVASFTGRTVTHEVGHWLNLFHTWGENMGGCNDDDNVNDTPSQYQASQGCPSFPVLDNCTNSGDGIMFTNFMDYADDVCMTMFTQGQKARVDASINVSRLSLFTAPCAFQSVLALYSISDFSAIQDDQAVILNWTSMSEEDGEYIGEHKMENGEWHDLAIVDQMGSNQELTYVYTHQSPSNGLHYYRIKHIAVSGVIHPSDVKSVLIELDENPLVFPIPASGQMNIINPFETEIFKVEIFSIAGEKVFEQNYNAKKIQTDINQLTSGIYYMTLSNEKYSKHLKWIKS